MLITSIMFLLLSNAVTLRRDKSILFSRVAILVLLYSFILALNTLYITNLDRGIGLFGGLFHATSTTQNFHIFIFLISAAILQLTGFYPRRVWIPEYSSISKLFLYNLRYYRTKILDKMGEQFKIIEYPLILLFIITGAVFLISSSDLVSIFLSIELQSYGLYLLSTLYRNSESATSGGLTYFLLGGLSSCFILLGTSLLYANSGTTNLDGIYVVTSISDLANAFTPHGAIDLAKELNHPVLDGYKSDYINISLLILSVGFLFKVSINISLLILSVGFLFKVSAAPFHFWSPDVYDAIPTIVTTNNNNNNNNSILNINDILFCIFIIYFFTIAIWVFDINNNFSFKLFVFNGSIISFMMLIYIAILTNKKFIDFYSLFIYVLKNLWKIIPLYFFFWCIRNFFYSFIMLFICVSLDTPDLLIKSYVIITCVFPFLYLSHAIMFRMVFFKLSDIKFSFFDLFLLNAGITACDYYIKPIIIEKFDLYDYNIIDVYSNIKDYLINTDIYNNITYVYSNINSYLINNGIYISRFNLNSFLIKTGVFISSFNFYTYKLCTIINYHNNFIISRRRFFIIINRGIYTKYPFYGHLGSSSKFLNIKPLFNKGDLNIFGINKTDYNKLKFKYNALSMMGKLKIYSSLNSISNKNIKSIYLSLSPSLKFKLLDKLLNLASLTSYKQHNCASISVFIFNSERSFSKSSPIVSMIEGGPSHNKTKLVYTPIVNKRGVTQVDFFKEYTQKLGSGIDLVRPWLELIPLTRVIDGIGYRGMIDYKHPDGLLLVFLYGINRIGEVRDHLVEYKGKTYRGIFETPNLPIYQGIPELENSYYYVFVTPQYPVHHFLPFNDPCWIEYLTSVYNSTPITIMMIAPRRVRWELCVMELNYHISYRYYPEKLLIGQPDPSGPTLGNIHVHGLSEDIQLPFIVAIESNPMHVWDGENFIG